MSVLWLPVPEPLIVLFPVLLLLSALLPLPDAFDVLIFLEIVFSLVPLLPFSLSQFLVSRRVLFVDAHF